MRQNIQHLCFLLVVVIAGCAMFHSSYVANPEPDDLQPPIIDLRDCKPKPWPSAPVESESCDLVA